MFECDIAASDLCVIAPKPPNSFMSLFACAFANTGPAFHCGTTPHRTQIKRVNNGEDIMSIQSFLESSVCHLLCSQTKTKSQPTSVVKKNAKRCWQKPEPASRLCQAGLVNTTWDQNCPIVLNVTYKYPTVTDKNSQQAGRRAVGLLLSRCSVRFVFYVFTDNTILFLCPFLTLLTQFYLENTSSFIATQQLLFFLQ